MWNLIKMEFNTLRLNNNKKYVLLMTIIPLVAFRFLPHVEVEALYIILSYFFIYLISIYTMGNEDPKSHYIINSLPINKSKVVFGKYIFIHLGLLFSMVYLGGYLLVMKTLGIIVIKKLDLIYLQTAIMLMIMVMNVNILLMSKPGLFARIIYSSLFGYSLWFLTDFGVINRLSKYKMYILILTLLSIAISLALSIYLYNKREFARR